jgi:hypothetical protein
MGNANKTKAPRSKNDAIGNSSVATAQRKINNTRSPDMQLKLLFTGCGGSGKTNLLYALKDREFPHAVHATVGFNCEEIELDVGRARTAAARPKLQIWDVGGGDKISPLLYHYTSDAHGIVFFVPSFWQVKEWSTGNWFKNFDKSNIETASHHDPEWVHQLRRHASTRGMPLMILVNEPVDPTKIRMTKEDILNMWDLDNIHERPTKVVTTTTGSTFGPWKKSAAEISAMIIEPMYNELAWFYEIECRYAAGDEWVSLSISNFMPPMVRRTANVLTLVELFLGTNKIFGFVSAANRSVEGDWVVAQAKAHHFMDHHDLSLVFRKRLDVDYPAGGTFDLAWYDNNPLGQGGHYDLLRMLFESIRRNGRKEALKHIFNTMGVEKDHGDSGTTTAATGPATGPATGTATGTEVASPPPTSWLPVTFTYFWLHMVDYHMRVLTMRLGKHQLSFRSLCLENPCLSHSGLIYDYYSRDKVRGTDCAKEMVLPDLKPLPSVLPKVGKFVHGEMKS